MCRYCEDEAISICDFKGNAFRIVRSEFNEYLLTTAFGAMKINYCPKCGRKLVK